MSVYPLDAGEVSAVMFPLSFEQEMIATTSALSVVLLALLVDPVVTPLPLFVLVPSKLEEVFVPENSTIIAAAYDPEL